MYYDLFTINKNQYIDFLSISTFHTDSTFNRGYKSTKREKKYEVWILSCVWPWYVQPTLLVERIKGSVKAINLLAI